MKVNLSCLHSESNYQLHQTYLASSSMNTMNLVMIIKMF